MLKTYCDNGRQKKRYAYICLFLITCFFSGCASLKEGGKKIWGSSISHLDSARSKGKSSEFVISLDECFVKTEKILTDNGALVYLKDKQNRYMAAMNFKGHVDTTEVGIFFAKLEDRLTKVEVASMSPSLAQDVAKLVFEGLLKEIK